MVQSVKYVDLNIMVGNIPHKIKVQDGIKIGKIFAHNGNCYITNPMDFSNGGVVQKTNQISMTEEEFKLLMNCINNYNEGIGNALSYMDIEKAEKLNEQELNQDMAQGFSKQYNANSKVSRFTDNVQLDTYLYKNNEYTASSFLSYSFNTIFMDNISNAISASKDGKVTYDYIEGDSYLRYIDKNNKPKSFGNIFGKLQNR